MRDFIGRTIFENDAIAYTVRTGSQLYLTFAKVLDVERDRIQVQPFLQSRHPVWLKTPAYIAILDEPQEWELLG